MSFSLEATARTPAITLDETAASLTLAGESYPEDVPAFYEQLHKALSAYFSDHQGDFKVDIKLTYFNSSSARALMELLDALDAEASEARAITVSWFCDPDDDITREFAEDISADVEHLSLTILDLDSDQ